MPITQVEAGNNRLQQNIANILASSKKVIVVVGAGISTNCGIPVSLHVSSLQLIGIMRRKTYFYQDFRSENGLYAMIQSQHQNSATPVSYASSRVLQPGVSPTTAPPHSQPLTKLKGKDLFSSSIWNDSQSTATFYKFIASLRKKIRDDVKQTTKAHRFIRTLRDSRRLVRCYTQNIDGLEAREGLCADLERGKGNRSRFTKKAVNLPRGRANLLPGGDLDGGCEVVQLHGDLKVLRCNTCGKTCGWDENGREALFSRGKAPECNSCQLQNQDRQDRGKRPIKVGSLRPNIILYGEEHPSSDAIGAISAHDISLAPDTLLILGTSLHVHGLKVLVKEFAKSVHAEPAKKGKVIFVNLTKPSESVWKDVIDYWVPMDCDEWVTALRRHRPDMWQIQEDLRLKVNKPASSRVQKISVKEDNGKENIQPQIDVSKSRSGQPTIKDTIRRPLQSIANESLITSVSVSSMSATMPKFDESLQVPTPPPSGHRPRFRNSSIKRSRSDEVDVFGSPSKRKKGPVMIRQDTDVGSKKVKSEKPK